MPGRKARELLSGRGAVGWAESSEATGRPPWFPNSCLGTLSTKLCFAALPSNETEFRVDAFPNRSLGTRFKGEQAERLLQRLRFQEGEQVGDLLARQRVEQPFGHYRNQRRHL